MEVTLEQIKEGAIEGRACKAQLNKFLEFLNSGNELEAWQTVLGNYEWLIKKGIITTEDVAVIETLANGIGKIWYESGQLRGFCTYKEGKPDRLYQWWYESGKLKESYTYKEGKLDGLYQRWYESGQLKESFTYKNGKRV